MSYLRDTDAEVFAEIQKETQRLEGNLELIASENVVSEAVLEAQGCVMTNKYAEGYPGKRYYGGCENSDVVENLAITRLKQLFGADHANVQPHSGASNPWPSPAPRNYSAPIMSTSSPIPVLRQTWRCIFQCSSRGILIWA